MLSDRPLRRHVPTAAGVAALGDDDLLYHHPVSRLWLRLLAERLDGVALLYELAALIADADPEEDPRARAAGALGVPPQRGGERWERSSARGRGRASGSPLATGAGTRRSSSPTPAWRGWSTWPGARRSTPCAG
ncbi:MAG: hypothetical protein OXM57_14440 [bacterium]|nr:hypothetical protein [bacterium]